MLKYTDIYNIKCGLIYNYLKINRGSIRNTHFISVNIMLNFARLVEQKQA